MQSSTRTYHARIGNDFAFFSPAMLEDEDEDDDDDDDDVHDVEEGGVEGE